MVKKLSQRVADIEKKLGLGQDKTDINLVLDMSGSMKDLAPETISAVNAFIKEQQTQPGEATFSLVMFDTEFITVHENTPLKDVKPLTSDVYKPRGMTALLDAVGITLDRLDRTRPEKAIVVIVTDGYENSSRKYTSDQIKSKIKDAQTRNWQVVYLGANQDSWAIGSHMYGTNAGSTATWYGGIGLATGMGTTSSATMDYRATGQSVDLDAIAKKLGNTDGFDTKSSDPNTSPVPVVTP